MNPLSCLIVDDEPVARKVIREYIEDLDFLQLKSEAEDPIKANNILKQDSIDLLFLDIEMPKMNGIDFLKNLHLPPMVIMTTAYPEYALQGFELDVLDYLVKPIGAERFLKAVNKAKDYHDIKNGITSNIMDFFFIKCDKKIEKILFKEVLYIEGFINYITIFTTQKKFVSYLTLKGFEESLPGDSFIRIHKSYLVPLSSIKTISGNEILLGQNISLPISKYYKTQVMDKIERRLFKR